MNCDEKALAPVTEARQTRHSSKPGLLSSEWKIESSGNLDALRAMGFELTIVKNDFGRVNGIVIDPATKFRLGGADPRENSYALGW